MPNENSATWTEPTGVNPRGTVVIFPGRGEDASTYWRLGPRLASDAYRVVVAEAGTSTLGDDAVRPVVALGSDTGAIDALDAAAGGDIDAVIVAGIPVGGEADSLLAEITSRTACSVHQGVLEQTPAVALPALLEPPKAREVDVPVLAIHGAEDHVAPLDDALALYFGLNPVQVSVVAGGLHDILNDLEHRSVAATIVLFLERLRAGNDLAPIVEDRSLVRQP